MRRSLFAAVGVVALVAVAGVLLVGTRGERGGAEASTTIGGPFSLTTHTGATLSDSDLKGTPFAVFFGFTHCPEICPTTLWDMSLALKELGPDADRLKVLFITVDPERDTPEFLGHYLGAFDPRIIGLIGSEAELAELGRDYHAYWEKVPTKDGGYTMNHTASVYLMDADGHFVDTIGYGEDPSTRLAKLRRLIDG
ncbi:SCO family protein [Acuticoccus mangrovi]|uniref:SCO family protein n=1 Tax=Acuticoccus mangrovi TaxID=2796142 RepID=A0A934IST2_9HYPH|nr:SCO family protein [Acuticoccus mangrovi]MBJ3777547.1 SCO family protein [Acuticoccus mangrovi]